MKMMVSIPANAVALSSNPSVLEEETAPAVFEEPLKDEPTPLRRHEPHRSGGGGTNDDSIGDADGNPQARGGQPRRGVRQLKFASITGRSRDSFLMKLGRMASSSFSIRNIGNRGGSSRSSVRNASNSSVGGVSGIGSGGSVGSVGLDGVNEE